MADKTNHSNGSSFLTSALGVLGTIAVFAILVLLIYGLGGDKNEVVIESGEFPLSAAELRTTEKATLASYAWVNQEQGIVRVPVDRAKELVIQELNQ